MIVKLPVRGLKIAGWVGLIGSALLLILTYTPLGVEFQGNRNWVQLGPSFLRLQPSEFAKLALIVWGADVLARKQKLLDQPKHLFVPYLPAAGLIVLLIVFQGDAGTAAVVIGIVAAVLWMVGAPLRLFVGLAGARRGRDGRAGAQQPDPDAVASRRSSTRPSPSTESTTSPRSGCTRSPPAAGGASGWVPAGRSGAPCPRRTRTSSSR